MDEIEWSSPEFVARFGIHHGNLLEYLRLSPFWDRTCSNQTLQQQTQSIAIPHDCEALKQMTGREYLVLSPSLILLVERDSPNTTKPLACFYLIGSKVYKSPTLSACLGHLSLEISKNILSLPSFSFSSSSSSNSK